MHLEKKGGKMIEDAMRTECQPHRKFSRASGGCENANVAYLLMQSQTLKEKTFFRRQEVGTEFGDTPEFCETSSPR